MRLPLPFVKLPLAFDVNRLQDEISQFAEADWRPHPQGYAGNSALILISRDGGDNDDTWGEMQATANLARSRYLRQVLASFNVVVGRSRLMRLEAGAEVSTHSDIDYYWHDRVRIHVPIITDPGVRFICDGTERHMAAGEAWIFDNWRPHRVINSSGIRRIHLVIDTVGHSSFWRLAARATTNQLIPASTEFVPYRPGLNAHVVTERNFQDTIAHPALIKVLSQEIISDLRGSPRYGPDHQWLEALLIDFIQDWRTLWTLYRDEADGWPEYIELLQTTLNAIDRIGDHVLLPSNGTRAKQVLIKHLSVMIGNNAYASSGQQKSSKTAAVFDRPVIVLAAPRSGSTLLFETVCRHPELWTTGTEMHAELENIAGLSPRDRNYESNVLSASDATPAIRAQLLDRIAGNLINSRGDLRSRMPMPFRQHAVRFLEKTPKNILRIPFLASVFPDAMFIFLYRNATDNISSIIDAWQSGRFVTYPDVPGWDRRSWSLLLPPAWQKLNGKSLGDIATHQWLASNSMALEELSKLPESRWRVVDYDGLVSDPSGLFASICAFCELPAAPDVEQELRRPLPLSRYTLTPPEPEKWRRNIHELTDVENNTSSMMKSLSALSNRL